MVNEWHEIELGEVVTYQKGYAFKSKDYVKKGHPIARVSNFTERSIDIASCNCINPDFSRLYERYKLKKDDVVIATVGSWPTNPASVVGKAIKVPYDGDSALLNQNAVRLKAKNGLNQIFLFHLLKTKNYQDYIVGTAQGSANQASITLNAIFSFKFKLPNLHVQDRIAEILGTLDDKIDLNRQMNKTLEQMAQALYKSWFVDFDPVIDNALEAGNAIPGELTIRATKRKELGEFRKPLPDSIKNLFPSEFEFCDELDRWIPKGWNNGEVGEVAYVIGGGTPSTKIPEYFCENGIPWLSPKDLSGYEWKFISKGATDITELGLKKSSANLMPKGTVLFSSRAPIGYIAIAENEICTNQGFKSLVPKDGMVSEYLFQYLKLKTDDIEAISTGSTFKEISGTAMKSLEILIPPIDLLHHFKLEADAINDKMRLCHKETKTLKSVRDTLLPKLISGEVSINNKISYDG